MVIRQTKWQKYGRFGGFLLVAVLFLPVLGAYIFGTLKLLSGHTGVSMRPSLGMVSMPPMERGGMLRSLGNGKAMFESLDASMPMGMMSEAVVSATAPVDRQLAKSASLDLRAQSLEWTVGKIQEIAKNVGGYTESANVSEPKLGAKSAWLTIRVPADRLDATLDEVKQSAAAVVNEQLNIGDVTDQDIDLSARLSTKLAEEAALVSILEKVAKVSDIIEVTDRLAMVRGEIERMQAQQRLLKGQVTMAIVSISITEDPRVVTDAGQMRDGNVLKQSLSDLYRFGIALGSAIIILVVNGLPMLFVFGFFFWLSYRLARFAANRIMRKKK